MQRLFYPGGLEVFPGHVPFVCSGFAAEELCAFVEVTLPRVSLR